LSLRVNGGLLVLYHQDQDITIAVFGFYVDDLLIIAHMCLIGQIENQMKKGLRMYDLGSFSCNLGMNIEPNWEVLIIIIHEHSYIWMMVTMFSMDESRQVAAPLAIQLYMRKRDKEAFNTII
jgi:hypothetical protein